MKAITICQPYAHLIALGEKRVENRRWFVSYTGDLAIHAGLSRDWLVDGDTERYPDMAFGAIVAVVNMVACLRYDDLQAHGILPRFGWVRGHVHAEGPWCHVYERIRRLREPIPWKGAQRLWQVPNVIELEINQQIAGVPAVW